MFNTKNDRTDARNQGFRGGNFDVQKKLWTQKRGDSRSTDHLRRGRRAEQHNFCNLHLRLLVAVSTTMNKGGRVTSGGLCRRLLKGGEYNVVYRRRHLSPHLSDIYCKLQI